MNAGEQSLSALTQLYTTRSLKDTILGHPFVLFGHCVQRLQPALSLSPFVVFL